MSTQFVPGIRFPLGPTSNHLTFIFALRPAIGLISGPLRSIFSVGRISRTRATGHFLFLLWIGRHLAAMDAFSVFGGDKRRTPDRRRSKPMTKERRRTGDGEKNEHQSPTHLKVFSRRTMRRNLHAETRLTFLGLFALRPARLRSRSALVSVRRVQRARHTEQIFSRDKPVAF